MIAASAPLARSPVAVSATIVIPWRGTPSALFTPVDLAPRAAMMWPLAPLGMRGARRPGAIYCVRSDLPTLTEVAPWEHEVLAAHARPLLESLLVEHAGAPTKVAT